MKKNEASAAAKVAPETPIVPATPAPEAAAAPVQPAKSTPTPVDNAVSPATPVVAEGKPNVLNNLITKLKSFGVGPIVTIAVVAVVLVGGIIFSVASSTPKAVFKNAIKTMYKGANFAIEGYETYLDEYDITKNALLVNGNFTLESNIEDLADYELNKVTVGFEAGVDYKNEVLSVGGSLKGNKETVKLNAQVQNKEMYITSTLFKEVLKIDSEMLSELGVEFDFEEMKEGYEEFQKEYDTNPETYEYLAKTIRNALVRSIDSEFMEKEKDKIDVLDKEIKVTKYSYIFDEDAIQDLVTKVCEYLLEEEDFAKSLADATGMDKKDIKEALKEAKKSAKDIEFEVEYALNIYTRGLFNSYAGMGLEVEGKEYFSIYTDGKNIEMTYDDHVSGDYGTKVVMTMEKDGKGYKGVLKENKEKILEMNFKEMTEEVIDSEFVVYEDGEKMGTIEFYISVKEDKKSFVTDYKFKMTEEETKEYIGFKGNYTLTIKDSLDKTNTKGAISIEELDVDKVQENIESIAEKDEALGTLIDEAMASIEEEMLDLNYYDMVEIEEDEVANILTKNRATVLYVGKTNYSYYSEEPAYDLFNNLTDLQDELGFHSYYLNTFYVTSEFEELVKDVQYTCPATTNTEDTTPSTDDTTTEDTTPSTDDTTAGDTTTTPAVPTCTGYPAIYLIKDGKVQKAFRQTVTYDELSEALNEIGIN